MQQFDDDAVGADLRVRPEYRGDVSEGVSKQAHPLFISDTVRQFVYAAISRIGDFKNPQFIP